ncbi:MAG: histone deacetylase [Elusimicrobia bacterium]|nr:histone deacetylase [Elusimicrobiota bacterium]
MPKIFYSDFYEVDIGAHVFPTAKYRLIKDRLIKDKIIGPQWLCEPEAAPDNDILLAHDEAWLAKIRDGTITPLDEARLEVPYSKALAKASFLCAGGTIGACQEALKNGAGIHIGGGFHHAHRDHGEGFCVFNDIAVGIRVMQEKKKIKKAAIVDLDLHQGNGTAAIFHGDDSVFTLSMHQENNYPLIKPPSNLDVGLEDGTGDEKYLENLQKALIGLFGSFSPELVVYQAGADIYCQDMLGGLNVSMEGIVKRDELVFSECSKRGIPCAVTLGGGYAGDLFHTIEIHAKTIQLALKNAVEANLK